MQRQLISYIAPGAPATRRWATGNEPYLRPEIGFTPKWYREALGILFDETYHANPEYRVECQRRMRGELLRRFMGNDLGGVEGRLDALTGAFGACTVAGIYGVPLIFAPDNWPNCAHDYLTDEEVDALTPPDLDTNPFFQTVMDQVEWIAERLGRIEGFVNWQGVLNNAQRLRGETLFTDMMIAPERCQHLFDCVCTTMIEAAQRLHARQAETGVDARFFTVSNCLVNMLSPAQYRELLLPFDQRIAEAFGCIGIHNCAWSATPYLDDYAKVPHVAYIDMGLDSDLERARELFPNARRALMYTPMDVMNKDLAAIRADLERVAREYGPCDVVFADIEAGTPDQRVLELIAVCRELSKEYGS